MSSVGAGPILPIGAILAIPVLATAGALYLTFKGVCLAGQGAKLACDEVKRRREEAARRKARDLELLEKFGNTDIEHAKAVSLLRQAERKIEEVSQDRERTVSGQKRLNQEWKKEQQKLMKGRFERLAKMGADQVRVNEVRDNYLKALQEFSPPEPVQSNDSIDREADRLKGRAIAIGKHLKESRISPNERKYFEQLLKDGKYSQAISEGYRLFNLARQDSQLRDAIFSARLDLLARTYIPDSRKNEWLDRLERAENHVLSNNLFEAKKFAESVRLDLDQFEREIGDLATYKSLASKARDTFARIEVFWSDSLLPEVESRQEEFIGIRDAFRRGDYNRTIQEGEALLKAWEAEESELLESGSRKVEEVALKSVREVLTEMGYKVDAMENDITGRKDGRVFEVSYDPASGQLKYDLSHQGFPSQKVCDREIADFLLRLSEKGIFLDTSAQPTHPKGNVVEEIADEILRALQESGVAPDDIEREDEDRSIRFLVRSGWEEKEVQVDEDGDTYLDGQIFRDAEELVEELARSGVEKERERE